MLCACSAAAGVYEGLTVPSVGRAYGWGRVPFLGPTSSWLFCPLISLALLRIELQTGRIPWSVGSRLPVPEDQRAFWTSLPSAIRAIEAYAALFASLPTSDNLIANPHLAHTWRDGGGSGNRASAYWQEAAAPEFIQEIV